MSRQAAKSGTRKLDTADSRQWACETCGKTVGPQECGLSKEEQLRSVMYGLPCELTALAFVFDGETPAEAASREQRGLMTARCTACGYHAVQILPVTLVTSACPKCSATAILHVEYREVKALLRPRTDRTKGRTER